MAANKPINHVRHPQQAVNDDAWITALLHRAPFGVIATVNGDQPFASANLFVFDKDRHCLYMHTAQVGRTRTNIEAHEKVCFTTFEMGRFLPTWEALEFSVEYSGVVCFGRASIIRDREDARHALQMLLDKYAPHLAAGKDYRPPIDEEIKRTSVYRILIDLWSGKRETAPEDYPGAYTYLAMSHKEENHEV